MTLFEAAPRIAGTEDPEVSMELTAILEREGMRVVAGAQIQRVDRSDDGAVTITTASGRFIFDEVLVAAGRLPQVPAA